MKNIHLVVLLLLFSISSFAQKTFIDPVLENKLFKPYVSYFDIDHEWIYTHLNKSAYIQGDDIWFTSYVLNPVNKNLNFTTSKLYVELWSPDMTLVSRKILFVNTGTANNYIHLADSLIPGTYYFRTYTNWMRNFYQGDDFTTKINVLGHDKVLDNGLVVNRNNSSIDLPVQNEKRKELLIKPDYDIQFLPESGHFLEGADNIFGIKATDINGKGIKVRGDIFDADNQEIMSFSTNELGIDNIAILSASNQQYVAKVSFPDSTTHVINLPKTEPKGVIIHVRPYLADVVWFKIETNEATRRLNKTYQIMLHANGLIFNNYRLNFWDESSVEFSVKKKDLGRGIIYATIFDEDLNPIAERLFYNPDTTHRGNITFNTEPLTNDTIKLKVFENDPLNKSAFTKLSISILPEGSVLNHFSNSLLAESIFYPALKGNIENPNTYFEKNDIGHIVAIDNLLLTHGWRQYDWPTILKDTVHKFIYPVENEFAIEGRVKNWIKNKPELKSKISLLSPQNNLFLFTPVDSVGTFKFAPVYLSDSTWVVASAASDKGKGWNRVLQISIPESYLGAPEQNPPHAFTDKTIEQINDIPKLTKGVIRLKEVVISAPKKKLFENNIYIGMTSHTLEITKDNQNQFSTMEMLLLAQFNVKIERTQNGGYHFNMGRSRRSISYEGEPLLQIDDMKISDPSLIIDFPIDMVEAVAVEKDGFGGGMMAAFGTIAIKTRRTSLFDGSNSESTNLKRIIVKGYAPPKKYFEPKYIIQPGTTDYTKYATIYWEPNLVIDSTRKASVNFFVPKEIKSITIRTEGISNEGIIFLNEQKLILPGRN